jgi:hypothetical protein
VRWRPSRQPTIAKTVRMIARPEADRANTVRCVGGARCSLLLRAG